MARLQKYTSSTIHLVQALWNTLMPVMLNMLQTKWMGPSSWGLGCLPVSQEEGCLVVAVVALVEGALKEVVEGVGAITQTTTVVARITIQGEVGVTGVDSPEGGSGVLTGVATVVVEVIHEEEDTPEEAEASHVEATIPVAVATHVVAATLEGSPVETTVEVPATMTTIPMTSMKSRMTSQLRTATLATPLVTSTSPTIQMTSMTSM